MHKQKEYTQGVVMTDKEEIREGGEIGFYPLLHQKIMTWEPSTRSFYLFLINNVRLWRYVCENGNSQNDNKLPPQFIIFFLFQKRKRKVV